MKSLFVTTFVLLLTVSEAFSQQISTTPEFKTGRSTGSIAEKKMQKAPKRMLINSFRVNYQILYTDWEATRAGMYTGKTSAELSVAFEGVTEEDFLKLTDQAYQAFAVMVKNEGYEVLDASVLEGNKSIKKLSPFTGGSPNYSVVDGYISFLPSGFSYYSNEKNHFPLAGYMASIDALVVDIDLYVPFMVDSESGASKLASSALGGVSKVVASPSLRINSNNNLAYQYPKMASLVKQPLKDPLLIDGVFKDEKFKATATAQTNTSYQMGHITNVYSTDVNTEKIQVAEGDPEKYKKGVAEGLNTVLKASWQNFLTYL